MRNSLGLPGVRLLLAMIFWSPRLACLNLVNGDWVGFSTTHRHYVARVNHEMHLVSELGHLQQVLLVARVQRTHQELFLVVIYRSVIMLQSGSARIVQVECASMRGLNAQQQILGTWLAITHVQLVLIQLDVLQIVVGHISVLQVAWILL